MVLHVTVGLMRPPSAWPITTSNVIIPRPSVYRALHKIAQNAGQINYFTGCSGSGKTSSVLLYLHHPVKVSETLIHRHAMCHIKLRDLKTETACMASLRKALCLERCMYSDLLGNVVVVDWYIFKTRCVCVFVAVPFDKEHSSMDSVGDLIAILADACKIIIKTQAQLKKVTAVDQSNTVHAETVPLVIVEDSQSCLPDFAKKLLTAFIDFPCAVIFMASEDTMIDELRKCTSSLLLTFELIWIVWTVHLVFCVLHTWQCRACHLGCL